jgi:hypothetical protein
VGVELDKISNDANGIKRMLKKIEIAEVSVVEEE